MTVARVFVAGGHTDVGKTFVACALIRAARAAGLSVEALEGQALPLSPVVELCAARLAASPADLFVIEGVGGLMSPLADQATGLDLMTALNLPVLLVGGGYLGAINHTLTALEVLRTRGQTVAAVVVSQAAQPDAPNFAETAALVAAHAGATPVLRAPRAGPPDWAAKALDLLLDPRPRVGADLAEAS